MLADGSSRVVLQRGAAARYVDGQLLWIADGSLFAAPFNLKTLSVTKEPALVLDDVLMGGENAGALQVSAATGRLLLYLSRDWQRLHSTHSRTS